MKAKATKPLNPNRHASTRATTGIEGALRLYSAGMYAEALAMIEVQLRTHPKHAVALNIAAACARGIGRLEDAVRYWMQAVRAKPDYVDAHNNLGVVLQELKRFPEAEASYQRALAIQPEYANAHNNLGNLLLELKRFPEAEAAYRRALVIQPNYADAHYNLGNLLQEIRRFPEAEAAYQRAVAARTDYADAHNNLGNLLQKLRRFPEAEAAYRRAVALRPDYADAHNNLGNLLQELKRFPEAEGAYKRAIAIRSDFADAHNNLGSLFYALKRFAEAEAAIRRALAIRSDYAEAYNNLGILLKELARFSEAESAYGYAVAIRADYAEAHNNLGILLKELKRFPEAETAYRRAVAIRPDYAEAHNNLGNLLHALKRFPEAETAYRAALHSKADLGHALGKIDYTQRLLCAWTSLRQNEETIASFLDAGKSIGIAPFELIAMPRVSARQQRIASNLYAEKELLANSRELQLESSGTAVGKRVRVGYLSADFHEHATTWLLTGALEHHDRSKVSVLVYSYGPDKQDAARQRVRAACEHFVDLRQLSDEAAARQIIDDNVDILVDLKGYTEENRLGISALRPAPVIVSWLGYPGTLGHARLADYIVGDPIVTPLEHRDHFSETLALMPHCYQPNDHSRPICKKVTRREAGLPEAGIVFCSFNQSYKLNPETFDVWCRLLKEVPGSVLWLLEPTGDAIVNLRREAAARSVEPDRLVFAPKKPIAEHLGRLQLADLALDTFPCNSHTTGSDTLWAGVPLVTRIGETFASRVAASILHGVGMPELVTKNWEDYFNKARQLALDPEGLAALREKLIGQRMTKPLFDVNKFTRDLERLYERIWQQHCEHKKEHIVLSDIDADSVEPVS